MNPITNPTALTDQITAAIRDARTQLADIADHIGAPITPGPAPAWLSDHVNALQDVISRDAGQGCPHIGAAPAVVYAAVWAPGVLACCACAPTVLHPATDTEEMTCDRCRRVADRLHTGVLATGPFLLAFGLCPHCHRATRPDTHPPCSSPTPPATQQARRSTAADTPRSRRRR